ncbi:MAG TPA: methyltransferase domain-containing protein [Bryobacteraceae bacterium]|nr:methyltransferase domain-containing protein [Bryobacteraceae bacterium]
MNIEGWEQRYRIGETGKEDAPTALLVETAATLCPGTAIDLACGAGRNALYLAEKGWGVSAIDGSQTAIDMVRQRAAARGLKVQAEVADLTSKRFQMLPDASDLIVIAYYLQRNLFPLVKRAVRPGGLVLAIVHTPDPGENGREKRAAPGELRSLFAGWQILHDYEGASRDPAHRRPVAEIVAQRPEAK